MTNDDLAGLIAEHGDYSPEYDESGAVQWQCGCGLKLPGGDPIATIAAHQAAIIAAAGWVKGREEWAVKHHGYGNAAHYEPCADEEGARRRAALSAWSGYVEPTPVRRYVTDWGEVPRET